jgi:(Z)-2-((N-methylformamido)methylene)-5-hydroxybutyrolactone dehydrogenase
VATQLEEFPLFINGKSVDALSGTTFESQNPYTGRPWALIADGGPEDVDEAVAAARAAFNGGWGCSYRSQAAWVRCSKSASSAVWTSRTM